MLRKLLILVCLISATNAIAQNAAKQPAKTTEKQPDPIDYKQIGAPMPRLKVLLYHDTVKKNATTPPVNNDNSMSRKEARRYEEQQEESKKMNEKQYLTDKDLDNGSNLFVMMFNPTCSHCEDETVMLEKNIFLFNKTKLVLLANPGMKMYLPDFFVRLHVSEYPSIHVGIDSSAFINQVFLYQSLPQINIYNSDRKLIKIYNGEVGIDSLKKYID